ncbi:response regulator transcription factor [Halanaerobiaceae bacterium Z-7014]|uniref:Response regulator transcription factor n=1 Tax=Halonatronomonas betaini TaxID=2778430 RepID=A0A931AWH7_9FIRM|nr:response regulator transcription factor [Halonatronomonas betaini]
MDINNIAYILNISLENEYFRTIIDEGQEIARILAAYKSEVDLLDDDKEELINKIFAELDYKNPEILSEREIEILKKISEGKTNKEIAENLFITLNTVKWHTSNIYSKLSVKNRTEAVKEAKKLGLL